MKTENRYFDRELSWLSFNERVLQEAKDETVPLLERLRFLAIFSSNLDEFFRVRVASLKSLARLKKKERKDLDLKPNKLLKQINREVHRQQEEFGVIYRENILPELSKNQVKIVDGNSLTNKLKEKVHRYFTDNIVVHIHPVFLNEIETPFLENRALYFITELKTNDLEGSKEYALLKIPSDKLSRFHVFSENDTQYILFVDDIIRLHLSEIFRGKEISGCYAIKVSRDAELYIEDEFSGDMLEKVRGSLDKRKTGLPSRFLYDFRMPEYLLKMLMQKLKLGEDDLAEGDKYHNYHDFFAFPNHDNRLQEYERFASIEHPDLETVLSYFSLLKEKDALLHFPYHRYDYVVKFIEEAAKDSYVTDIKITLYRVAQNSRVVSALLQALQNGKKVTAFIEIKARFDEESNIAQVEELKKAGAKVFYNIPGIKVHCKICLVTRIENATETLYAYLSTGNFNEKTSKIYTDIGFFTADTRMTTDLLQVFEFLSGNKEEKKYEKLLVAPNHFRKELIKLIDGEIENARKGQQAFIFLKMNSLEDTAMIDKLYEASQAGVKINMVVRGICRLIPEVEGLSENIRIMSILGRFLEHSRIFLFHHGGESKIYVSSADWMKRNLSHRIEVAFQIENATLKKEILTILAIYWKDNVKARRINEFQNNHFRKTENREQVNSQMAVYELLSKMAKTSATERIEHG